MRRRRFRVISRPLDGKPRRRLTWNYGDGCVHFGLEIWTEEEYRQRDPSECRICQFLPGIGYLTLDVITKAEANDIDAEHEELLSSWRALRGIEEG